MYSTLKVHFLRAKYFFSEAKMVFYSKNLAWESTFSIRRAEIFLSLIPNKI
jgi:hypothetical protein